MATDVAEPTSSSVGGNWSSTESASSPFDDRSQSSVTELEDFKSFQPEPLIRDDISSTTLPTSIDVVVSTRRTLRRSEAQPPLPVVHTISRSSDEASFSKK